MQIPHQRSFSNPDITQTYLSIHQMATQSAQLQNNKNQTKNNIFELEPPRQLPKKSYSLQADMITGWKPRKCLKLTQNNVFPINFGHELVDQLVKNLARCQVKEKNILYKIAYLGPRPTNSYLLHQNRKYDNPYPLDKKLQSIISERIGVPSTFKIDRVDKLQFNSMFQSGNLDVAVQISPTQYDLFMRVDTNTRGHTNWFYFQVINKDFIGPVKFNICNFRREKSLYQRGLKPYGKSMLQKGQWKQVGSDIKYERKRFRYNFLYEDEDDQYDYRQRVCTYFNLAFTYNFQTPNDTVKFAYCIPYTYTDMKDHLKTLSNCKITESYKTLSGLGVPIVQVTDQTIQQHNKQIILLTARVHPGESNSSYNAQGFLNFICSQQPLAMQLRKIFHFYVIPMLNPDGVVAGNYRTSWFGKDLNRTYNQHRKYAFPQTFYLLEFAQQLKKSGKQRFQIYIDFHGHSVKKNVFMYGPDFNISHQNYQLCRQFPRIIGSITPIFRYYSCSFRITTQKTSTARAIFNRNVNIPLTYTMQSSNSSYFDSNMHIQVPFTAEKWKQMGADIAKSLYQFTINRNKKVNTNSRFKKNISPNKNTKSQAMTKIESEQFEKNSDDNISEGKSDSQPDSQDLGPDQLKQLQAMIQGKKQYDSQAMQRIKQDQKNQKVSPERRIFNSDHFMKKHDYMTCQHRRCRLKRQEEQKRMASVSNYLEEKALPPIITQNRASFFANRSRRRPSLMQHRVKNLSVADFQPNQQSSHSNRVSISQMIMDAKSEILTFEESQLVIKNTYIKRGLQTKKTDVKIGNRY